MPGIIILFEYTGGFKLQHSKQNFPKGCHHLPVSLHYMCFCCFLGINAALSLHWCCTMSNQAEDESCCSLWSVWKERLDAVFNGSRWLEAKMKQLIWIGIVDYGRLKWENIKKEPTRWVNFSEQWCGNEVIAEMNDQGPHWKLNGPSHMGTTQSSLVTRSG